MGITDLFRPRHRHSNATVRAEAVRQLGPDEAELVVTIARDDRDAAVRRIAIDKIDDAEVLADIARSEAERELRTRAEERAAGLWVTRAAGAVEVSAAARALSGLETLGHQKAIAEVASRAEHAEIRAAALAKLFDPKALAELARSASAEPSARTTAIERIEDLEVLRSIAVDEVRKDIALVALERLDDDAALEQVATKAKSKAARVRARKRLGDRIAASQTQAASPEDKRSHAERAQLARQAESLAQSRDLAGLAASLAELEAAWSAITGGEDAELQTRFARACERARRQNEAYAQAAAKRRTAPATAAKAGPRADQGPQPTHTDGHKPEHRAGHTASSEPDKAEAGAAEPGEAADGAPAAAMLSPEDVRAEEEKREEDRRREEERKRERRERQERDQAAFASLVAELEAAAEATATATLKGADKLLQKADKALESFSLPDSAGELVARFKNARQAFFIKVRELREADEWQRWANVPRAEALIARAKALLDDAGAEDLVEQLKALQNDWKQVGAVPQKKSQELWTSFKAICDQIYERVKSARVLVAEEQTRNLELKEALCVRAEALAESTEWDQAADEIKRLQREWKQIGPVPRKHSDAIWKRFRAPCDRFFERRKPYIEQLMAERRGNLEAKLAMCEKAEILAESTDWQEATSQLRDLQRAWRNIGPAPRKEADAVGQRFRAASERFFARRQEQRDAEKAERGQRVEQLRAEIQLLIAAASAAQGGPDAAGGTPEDLPASLVARTVGVRAAMRELEVNQRELLELADQLYRVMLDAVPDGFADTELDPQVSKHKKDKLLARAEEIAPRPQAPSSAAQTAEEMAQRLRAALAENALSSSLAESTEVRNIADTINELRAAWVRIGPVPGSVGDELEARFRDACQRALRLAGIEV